MTEFLDPSHPDSLRDEMQSMIKVHANTLMKKLCLDPADADTHWAPRFQHENALPKVSDGVSGVVKNWPRHHDVYDIAMPIDPAKRIETPKALHEALQQYGLALARPWWKSMNVPSETEHLHGSRESLHRRCVEALKDMGLQHGAEPTIREYAMRVGNLLCMLYENIPQERLAETRTR